MNREIKFRGKDAHADQWVFGYYESWKHFDGVCYQIQHAIRNADFLTLVSGETAGQFTGLLDKNEVEIFEGDRILYSNSMESGEGVITFDRGFNIEWDLKTVKTDNPTLISPLFYFGCSSEIEVIGNIHQNNDHLNQ